MSLDMLIAADDPRLRTPCVDVQAADPDVAEELQHLHAALSQFRQAHGFGRAIAAPQLGIMKRMVAVNLGTTPFEMLNPVIVSSSDETQIVWDDCLSLPDIVVKVQRHKTISVTYRDRHGDTHHWHSLPDDLAELVQHEVDHLDGILMTDRAIDENSIRPISEHSKLVGKSRSPHINNALT